MRHRILALAIAIAAVGCGGGDTGTTEPSQFPTGSVRSWFDALEAGDFSAAFELTYDQSMLVIAAAENTMPTADVAALLRRGVTPESAARYLTDFADALHSQYGASLEEVTVDDFTRIGDTYAAVTVTGVGSATIIMRRAPGGLWQVEMVGTLGPALITQVRSLLENAGEGEDADTVREVFTSDVIPALEAAASADPEDLSLASEIRVIRSLLGL